MSGNDPELVREMFQRYARECTGLIIEVEQLLNFANNDSLIFKNGGLQIFQNMVQKITKFKDYVTVRTLGDEKSFDRMMEDVVKHL